MRHRHLRLVTSAPEPESFRVPAAELPEMVSDFLAELEPEFAQWLALSDHEVATQIRHLAGDLYLVGLDRGHADLASHRFMLCVELAAEFELHRQGALSPEAYQTFLLLSPTLVEQSWIERSNSELAVRLRELQKRASEGISDDDAVRNYAITLRTVRNLREADLASIVSAGLTRRF